MASSSSAAEAPPVKALIFDLIGTCLDWHTAVLNPLIYLLNQVTGRNSHAEVSELALDWRQAFFDAISAPFKTGLPAEDIDQTHRRTLDSLLGSKYNLKKHDLPWEIAECYGPIGMHTAYIQRWSEDPKEDMSKVKEENDIFIELDGDQYTAPKANGGLLKLADLLGA
nr:hypothetical protein B0A51_11359 [Rachicladosporium sp. CCFEE 5018]